jgi:NAD(P)-dependent dehydrogenase (short-subunit alcohol dehydrogenase family)
MTEFEGLGGIVTGAGSGIGRAVTLRLAQGGGAVLAVDLRPEPVERLMGEAADLPGRIIPHEADVTKPDQVRSYAERAERELPRVWFFHNNAGVEGVHKDIVDTTEDEWQRVMAINLHSYFYGLKYVLPVMKRQGGGAVVITGSLLSLQAAPGRSDYTVSKHAVLGLARSAASEHARDGIKVNCICPGPIETPLMERSERLVNPEDPGFERRRFEEGTPIGRYGTPDEVAETIAFLLSPKVPYLTGAALSLDGGLRAV